MKKIVWIIGSLSCGKTTQNKMLLGLGGTKLFLKQGVNAEEVPWVYTQCGRISSLGVINESDCCGLDRVSSKLKQEGIIASIKVALRNTDLVIVESIMSASTWFDFLSNQDAELYMIRLHCDFEDNVRRLKLRQWSKEKHGTLHISDHRLTDANYEFIRKTRMQYEGIYKKFKDKCKSMEINTSILNDVQVHEMIADFVL